MLSRSVLRVASRGFVAAPIQVSSLDLTFISFCRDFGKFGKNLLDLRCLWIIRLSCLFCRCPDWQQGRRRR